MMAAPKPGPTTETGRSTSPSETNQRPLPARHTCVRVRTLKDVMVGTSRLSYQYILRHGFLLHRGRP